MWRYVAQYFAQEKNIIGYEIINEPFVVNPFRSFTEFIWPGL